MAARAGGMTIVSASDAAQSGEAERSSIEGEAGLLTRYGGWIVLVFGGILVGLSFAFRSSADVAAPGIVLGALCVVLAVVLERAEGAFEFTSTGIKTSLRRIRREARTDRTLNSKQKRDVVEVASEKVRGLPVAFPAGTARAYASAAYKQARRDVVEFEEQVRRWLTTQGWSVQQAARADQVDFIAEHDDVTMLVETKLAPGRLMRQTMLRWLTFVMAAHARRPGARAALFVAAPEITGAARSEAERARIEVYLRQEEDFQPLGDAALPAA